MALGQAAYPIESADGTPVTVKPEGSGNTVVLVVDQETKEHIGAIRKDLETIATLLQMIVGGGDRI
jgi:hypothetical protein